MSSFLTTDLLRCHVSVFENILFILISFKLYFSSSNALQQCPSLRGGGGELPAADGRRGPVESQWYSNTTDECGASHSEFITSYRESSVAGFTLKMNSPSSARSALSRQTTL